MYHHINTSPGMITVSPGHFAAQMAYLANAGYTTIGGKQLAAYLAGEPLPKRSVMLTFDDGYLDNWVHALPVLQAHGLTALCFVETGWIGEGRVRAHVRSGAPLPPRLSHRDAEMAIENGQADRAILRWSEIDAMREAGTFEFHSHTHPTWTTSARDTCIGTRSPLPGVLIVSAGNLRHLALAPGRLKSNWATRPFAAITTVIRQEMAGDCLWPRPGQN
jgi:peptidoglycan/xylan/chitin deacetylase (PgdA/CDA1 family)